MQRGGWILSITLWVISLGVGIPLRKPEWLIVALAMQIVIVIVSALERSSSSLRSFRDRGLQVTMGDSKPGQVLHNRDRGMMVRFSANGRWEGRTCNCCEFVVTRRGGRGSSQVRFYELALSVKTVADVQLVRRGLIRAAIGPGHLDTRCEAVNRRWELESGDPGQLSCISSDVLELMNAFDRGVTQWCVQDGWLSVTCRNTLSARTLEPLLSRLDVIAAAIESGATPLPLPAAPVSARCPTA